MMSNSFWSRFLVPAPAILVLFVFLVLIGRGLYFAPQIAGQYRVAARQAIEDGEQEQAQFYYSRLIGQGDSGSRQDQFNWASLLAAAGDVAAAEALMANLAPDRQVGYAPAHREMAKRMIGILQQPRADKSEIIPKLAHHLRRGAWDPTPENDVLWAAYHLSVEQYDQAVARYASAASAKPEMWASLVDLYRQLGRGDDVKRASERAVSYLESRLVAEPTGTADRLTLAKIHAENGDFPAAERVIRDGLRIAGLNPELRRAAGMLRLMQLQQIDASDPQADRKRLELITQAASLSPDNPAVYQALAAFYQAGSTEEKKASYRQTLEEMIINGSQVAAAHFALGNIAFMEGRENDSVLHFETAMEINPAMSAVANNLAWVLCEKPEPDYERAEQLIAMALKKSPDHVSFIDTLATIKFRTQAYREALPLLEKVLPVSKGAKKTQIHERLAVIYETLGQPSLAASHRERAEIRTP